MEIPVPMASTRASRVLASALRRRSLIFEKASLPLSVLSQIHILDDARGAEDGSRRLA
jgi:hypothetical protein